MKETTRVFKACALPFFVGFLALHPGQAFGDAAQTAVDFTHAMGSWTGQTGSYSKSTLGTIPERYGDESWVGNALSIYATHLPNGTYEVEVYCNASEAWKSDAGITDDNRNSFTALSANNIVVPVPAYTTNAVSSPTLYTLSGVKVTDGNLSVAVKNLVKGPNWFIVKLNKITLTEATAEEIPNTVVPECVTVNGVEYLTGKNLIENGSFEGNPALTWNNGAGKPIVYNDFHFGNGQLTALQNAGAAASGSIKQAWPIEAGKTYIFSYKVRSTTGAGIDASYQALSLTNDANTENSQAYILGRGSTANGNPTVTTDGNWTTNTVVFTNTSNYPYALFNARWLASAAAFDDFYLVEATPVTDASAALLKTQQQTEADEELALTDATRTVVREGDALITATQGDAALQVLADNNVYAADLSGIGSKVTLTNPVSHANLLVENSPVAVVNAINSKDGVLTEGAALQDKVPFFAARDYTGTISYIRTLPEGSNYGTLVLPFAVTGTEDTKFYRLCGAEKETLYFEEETTVPANTPCMFHTTQTELSLTGDGLVTTPDNLTGESFAGIYQPVSEVPVGSYIINQNQYWLVDSDVALAPFRAYLHTLPATAEAGSRLNIGFLSTGIVSTPVDNVSKLRILSGKGRLTLLAGDAATEVRVYAIGGQLIQVASLQANEEREISLAAGTYIINGVKIRVY